MGTTWSREHPCIYKCQSLALPIASHASTTDRQPCSQNKPSHDSQVKLTKRSQVLIHKDCTHHRHSVVSLGPSGSKGCGQRPSHARAFQGSYDTHDTNPPSGMAQISQALAIGIRIPTDLFLTSSIDHKAHSASFHAQKRHPAASAQCMQAPTARGDVPSLACALAAARCRWHCGALCGCFALGRAISCCLLGCSLTALGRCGGGLGCRGGGLLGGC